MCRRLQFNSLECFLIVYVLKYSVLTENLRYSKANRSRNDGTEKTSYYSQFPRGGDTPCHGGPHMETLWLVRGEEGKSEQEALLWLPRKEGVKQGKLA